MNPGPHSDTSSSQLYITSDNSYIIKKNNVSLVHYNVQSALHKMDILGSELSNFHVICLSETWFNSNMKDSDVMLDGFRNDRITDNHGGVAVYVKSNIACTRRTDLEIQGIQCVRIEIRLNCKRLLIGTFYRPPNSDQLKLEAIVNSIDLAIGTRISDIIISGDFNFDILKGAFKKQLVIYVNNMTYIKI